MSMTSIVLPAEWAEQDFVQLTFPHENSDWASMLNEVNPCFVEIVCTIANYENVLIVCADIIETKKFFTPEIPSTIRFVELPSNDTWARDHGGITVFRDNKPVICDFGFNGWGLKYAANFDNQLTRKLYDKKVFNPLYQYQNCLNFVLEGGSIESDGQGTLLTNTQCLLAPNRNDKSKTAIEQDLKQYFGLERVLWLNHGYLAGDDTDSHIDTLARFCNEETIAYVQCNDKTDEHFDELKKMEDELHLFTTKDGKPYQLIPLPMADAEYDEKGNRLPATYANFLIVNGAVLVPIYNSPKDETAIRQLRSAFPDRDIVPINCLALIQQHGSLHCVTMQYPKTV